MYLNTVNGQEFHGTIIGYSSDTDVAVIHVPDLIGEQPFPLEANNPQIVGEKIVALGSPAGLDNIASEGYITHKDQCFNIGSYIYEDLYQISSPISVGSSGGPLVAKASGKIIAINSAKNKANAAIGFSIPLYKVTGLIQSWIDWPMSKQSILAKPYTINKQENFILPPNYDSRDGNHKDSLDVNLIYTRLIEHT